MLRKTKPLVEAGDTARHRETGLMYAVIDVINGFALVRLEDDESIASFPVRDLEHLNPRQPKHE